MSKHRHQKTKPLSQDDRRALELFEDAQRQYQRYQELNQLTAVLPRQDPPDPPAPNWHSPLTLVIRN